MGSRVLEPSSSGAAAAPVPEDKPESVVFSKFYDWLRNAWNNLKHVYIGIL